MPTPRFTVLNFADVMEQKLKENDHKGGWEEESLESLLGRALQEHMEVNQALHDWRMGKRNIEGSRKVIRECADAANFYMMVADNIAREQVEDTIRKAPGERAFFEIDPNPMVIDEKTCPRCRGSGIGMKPGRYICGECGGLGRKDDDESTGDTKSVKSGVDIDE